MQPNDPNDGISSSGDDAISASGNSGANEFSGSGSSRESFDFSGTSSTSESSQSIKDRARGALGAAGGRLADVGSTVRDRAGVAKDKLADALESGAERLRTRAQADTLITTASGGTAALAGDGRMAHLSDRVAGGMERSAEWLRDADLDGIKASVEQQVKEHPARTLLIAAGLGYLIGRAFRGGNQ